MFVLKMTAALAPDSASQDALDPAAERAERQCRMLVELAQIGVRLALTLERQAAAAADAAEAGGAPVAAPFGGDLGLVFDRLTRAVRLTLMLETRIAEGEVGRQAQVAEARAKAAQAAQRAAIDAWEEAQVEAVVAVVEKTLDADGQDDETIVARLRETREYLESGDEDYDILEHPLSRVIAVICEEFGVKPDWSLWTDTDWAIEEAQDRPRGSPYARRSLDRGDDDPAPAGKSPARGANARGGSP